MAFGKLFVDLALRDKGFSAALQKAGGDVKGLESSAKSLDRVIGGTLKASFVAATATMTAFGAATAKVGVDFQKSITMVKALSKDGVENFQALEDEARRLGATTEFSARQSAEAMTNFARAGMTAREIIAATGPALMMAGGAGESMSLATQSMAGSLKQFSLDASQSGHVADVFTVALKNSLFNLQGLNDAMKYGGPIGAAFGMSIEDTVAAVAQFRNMGLDASMAGTAFRMTLIQLSKGTPKAEKALKRYGLTLEDVNPEMHSFRDIMIKFADANLTAKDAVSIFGARAAGQVRVLSQQMKDADFVKEFDDLTESLYNSSDGAGAAKIQYDELGKTVERQLLISKSALEELFLKVFDTYKEPLFAFFAELGETIQFVGEQFVFSGNSLKNGFGSALEQATEFLRENKSEVAAWFQTAYNAFQTFVTIVATLVPLIDDLAVAFTVLFVRMKFVAMVSSVQAASQGLTVMQAVMTGLTTQARLFGAARRVALGPWGLIITAALSVVAIWKSVKGRQDDATRSLLAYENVKNRIDNKNKQNNKALEKQLSKQVELQQDQLENAEFALAGIGLTATQIEAYKQSIMGLTAEQAAEKALTGELIMLRQGQVQGLMTAQTAYQVLQAQGIDTVDMQKKLADSVRSTKKAFEEQKEELANAELALIELQKKEEGQIDTLSDFATAIIGPIQNLGLFRAGVFNLRNELDLSKDTFNAASSAYQSFANAVAQGDARGTPPGGKDVPDENKAKQRRAERERTAQHFLKLKRMEEDYQDQLAGIGLEGIELKAFQLQEIQKEINRSHDEQLKGVKDLKLREAIEESRANSLLMAQRIEVAKADVEAEERMFEQQEAMAARAVEARIALKEAAQLDAYGRENDAMLQHQELMREIELTGITVTEEEKQAIHSGYLRKRLNAATEDLQARLRVEGRAASFSEKLNIAKLKSAVTTDNKILSNNAKSSNKIAALKAKQSKLASKLADATTEKQKKRLEKRQRNIKKALAQEAHDTMVKNGKVLNSEQRKFIAIEKMQKFAQKTGIAALGEGAKKATGFINKVKEATEDAQDPEGPKTPWGKFIKGAGKAAKAVGKIGGAFAAMGKKAVGIFTSFTGGSFDPMAMVDDAAGKKGEMGDAAVEAEAARREAAGEEEMTADEEAAVRAEGEGKFDPKVAAAEVADEQAQAMMDRMNMALEMIPVFIQKIADNLPTLIDALVSGIPAMITSLVDSLSTSLVEEMNGEKGLMLVIAEAVPKLIVVLIEAIPKLIPPIIEALFSFISEGIPQIVASLAEMIPQLIMSLAEGLPLLIEAVVAMIPQVLQSIIEMLPALIDSLIALVLNLITSLLEQLPILIVELVNQIPVLITALVDAIPLIIQRVVSSLPQIITALINAIPIIILGLIKSIPKLIGALVGAIPTLIKAVFHGLVGIVRAIVVDLPPMLARAIGAAFRKAWKGIKKAMSGMFEKLNPMNWFGDTPGPIRVGSQPQTFGFAANDYIVAAKKPEDLLAQATQLIESNGVPRITKRNRETSVAQMSSTPIGAAAMFGDDPQSRSPAERLAQNIKVQVEGETIDNALITARERGRSPQIWNEIERVAGGGASIGIERHDAE